MKYKLTENIKKSIQEFEEELKTLVNTQKNKQKELEEVKKKINNAISLIQKMEK